MTPKFKTTTGKIDNTEKEKLKNTKGAKEIKMIKVVCKDSKTEKPIEGAIVNIMPEQNLKNHTEMGGGGEDITDHKGEAHIDCGDSGYYLVSPDLEAWVTINLTVTKNQKEADKNEGVLWPKNRVEILIDKECVQEEKEGLRIINGLIKKSEEDKGEETDFPISIGNIKIDIFLK